jgi:hypothetical protein
MPFDLLRILPIESVEPAETIWRATQLDDAAGWGLIDALRDAGLQLVEVRRDFDLPLNEATRGCLGGKRANPAPFEGGAGFTVNTDVKGVRDLIFQMSSGISSQGHRLFTC